MKEGRCPKCGQLLEVGYGEKGTCPKCVTYIEDDEKWKDDFISAALQIGVCVLAWIGLYVILAPIVMVIDAIKSFANKLKVNGIILLVSGGVYLISIVLLFLCTYPLDSTNPESTILIFPEFVYGILMFGFIVSWILGFIFGRKIGRTYSLHIIK